MDRSDHIAYNFGRDRSFSPAVYPQFTEAAPREFNQVRSTSRLKTGRARLAALMIVVASAALASADYAQEITVQKESGASVKLTATEITTLPHQDIDAEDHGRTVRFTGVPLRLVLEKAGVTLGDSLRGKRLASCLVVEAADGYRVVIALPELDPGFTDRVILLADKADGHPMDAKEGPFRVVVPGEKRPARWVRQVTTLKVLQVQ